MLQINTMVCLFCIVFSCSCVSSFSSGDEGPPSLGSEPVCSRFMLAATALLIQQHEAVDLSLLINGGVFGLTQTILRYSSNLYLVLTAL